MIAHAQIFQKLERESERRAQEELEEQDKISLDVQEVVPAPRQRSVLAAHEAPADKTAAPPPDAAPRGRDRRRGSIVISIFGQVRQFLPAPPAPI